MKIILLQEIKKVGQQGEIVEVADGFARNYLLPKSLAVEATEKNLKILSQEKAVAEKRKKRELDKARQLAQRLHNASLHFKVKSGEEGKLFGSITATDITQLIKEKLGIDIDRRKIELEEPIKRIGRYSVRIKLEQEVYAWLNLEVEED